MEQFEKRIKLQRDMERFNIEKSIVGTVAYEIEQDIFKGVSEEDILQKARSGVYVNTAQNRKLGRVGQKYGPEKKEDKMDLSKHSIQELKDAMRIRVKSGMSESNPEMKQLQAELDKRQHSKPKHIGDMSKDEKLSAAKSLGIKNPESLSSKELDKQLIDKNIEKQIKEFKNKKNDSK